MKGKGEGEGELERKGEREREEERERRRERGGERPRERSNYVHYARLQLKTSNQWVLLSELTRTVKTYVGECKLVMHAMTGHISILTGSTGVVILL